MCEELKDNLEIEELLEEDEDNQSEYIPLKDHKYAIVSKVAYLIGVASDKFADEGAIYKKDIYTQLNINKNARIVRNLCSLRTAIEKCYAYLLREFQSGRDVLSVKECIPESIVLSLSNDGIRLSQKRGTSPVQYIIEINKTLSDRINNVKSVFPTWINWEYIKDMFIMPNGFTVQGAAEAAQVYYDHKACYPYAIYINWPPEENGNILLNDRKFVSLLYEQHNDRFTDISKVMDASEYVKSNIYDFIDAGNKIAMIVDCENSSVYNLISMLRGLKWENCLEKISKIVLVDGTSTNEGWKELENYTDIPVEHIMTERLKEEKSLVDGTVIAKTYEEFYENSVDSFILLSSDSDFWALIKMLKKAKFLVAVEHIKCGPDLKEKLEENCIFYCYLDDFYSGEEADQMKNDMLLKMIAGNLKERSFNLKDVLDDCLLSLRIDLTEVQKKQFYTKYLKSLQFSINEDGKAELKFKDRV